MNSPGTRAESISAARAHGGAKRPAVATVQGRLCTQHARKEVIVDVGHDASL